MKEVKDWSVTIPLLFWEISIHNKHQLDIYYWDNSPIRPKFAVHFGKKFGNLSCQRLFFVM